MSSVSSNVVTLIDNSGTVTGVTYVDNSAYVTSGESYTTPPSIVGSGGTFTITFDANRKASSDVATSFNTASGGAAYEYTTTGGDSTPSELNFYFAVQVSFKTAQGTGSATFNLGQGNYMLTNNWWIGGVDVVSSTPSVNVPIDGTSQSLVLPLSAGTSSFSFAPGSVVTNT